MTLIPVGVIFTFQLKLTEARNFSCEIKKDKLSFYFFYFKKSDDIL